VALSKLDLQDCRADTKRQWEAPIGTANTHPLLPSTLPHQHCFKTTKNRQGMNLGQRKY